MTRRRVFPLLAAVPFSYGCRRRKNERLWSGVLFHNPVNVRYHFTSDLNNVITARVQELEGIFSLHESTSEITRLNSTGSSSTPSEELLLLLEKCRTFHQVSKGLFDPTIQSYWSWLNEKNQAGEKPTEEERSDARNRVDFLNVHISSSGIQLNGTKLTLNAVAQGFATDQITQLLRHRGVRSALVNLGEYRAIGGPFIVEIRHPSAPKRRLRAIDLKDGSLAVSSGSGHRLNASGKDNHLFSPVTGQSPPALRTVIVQAPDATTADAWATILSLQPELSNILPDGVKAAVL